MENRIQKSKRPGGQLGQAATETMILVGFALVFIIPLALLFLSSSNSQLGQLSVSQSKATAQTIADTAGQVYLEGPGAQETIAVNFPSGVQNVIVENGLVILTVDSDGRSVDVIGSTFANVTGNFSGKEFGGLMKISLVQDGNYVNITSPS
jgi:uncharacterized protein (UPF0333 family)